ncbi:hypothetical protein PYW07_011358 [Mythimna separata]|uniref:Uncharacterized protein n=1 Tax=Mythimna separata TaxID=271217 RepID=A0AAD7Y972_MYTSE|nr:hypothetical protein PYW07_011358 [Mythimna separata]
MCDQEEKDTSTEDKCSTIPVIITAGHVKTIESKYMQQSAVIADSGDSVGRILQENLKKSDETASELTKNDLKLINTDVGQSSGDYTATEKVIGMVDKNIEAKNVDSNVKTSEFDINTDKAESSISILAKRDLIELKKADDLDEIEDEDIELRWDDDDDDGSSLAVQSGDGKADTKNDDILSEEQLLEEPWEVVTKEMSTSSEDVPKDKVAENILSLNNSVKKIEPLKVLVDLPKKDIPSENDEDEKEKSLEEELLKEPDLSTESINSPEMDFDLLQEHEKTDTEMINSPESDFEVLQETDTEEIKSPEVFQHSVEESEVQKPAKFDIDSAMKIIAEIKSLHKQESMVEEEESEINPTKQLISEAREILEEKSIDKEVQETEINSPKQLISEDKSLLEGQSTVKEGGEFGIDNAKPVIADVEEIIEEKSIDKEVQETETNSSEDKSLLEEQSIVKEVSETEIDSAKSVVAELEDILEEKSIDKEVQETGTNSSEDSLLEEKSDPKIDSLKQVMTEVKENNEEKGIVEPVKETESAQVIVLKEIITDKHTEEVLESIIADQLLAKSENIAQTDIRTLKMPSVTNVEKSDDVMLEENLLKEADSNVKHSDIAEKEVLKNKEDDVLLEHKLLEETETVAVIPESDIAMDVDDDKEGELLKVDGCQDDKPTPMDVDVSEQSIEDQDKLEDQLMDDPSEMANKDKDVSVVDETNLEKVLIEPEIELKSKVQPDDQAKTTEDIIDHPIEQTTETEDIIKDIPEDKAKIEEKVIDKTKSETVDQLIDDKNKIEDKNKEVLTLDTNTTEQSVKSPEETSDTTVSITPGVLEKSIPEDTTLVIETTDKINEKAPEEVSKSTNDVSLNKPEEIKENLDTDTNLDKTNVAEENSPKNTSMFFADSPLPIKPNHGLHKPDVMLEIPTQELIDMDDTDLSMHLDQSDIMVDLNDVYENVDEEETVDKVVSGNEAANDRLEREAINDTGNEKSVNQNASVDKIVTDDDTVKEKTVDQETEVSKTAISTDNDKVNDELVKQKAETATVTDDATVKEKSVDQDVIVKEKSVDQDAIVSESTVSELQKYSEIVRSDEKVEEIVVQKTVEENMETMFADDEVDAPKEVPECVASTSQALPPMATSPTFTQMTPDTSDEVPEISDSLGLLAESSGRMMEDDEEPEDDDDGDDDDDFDHDESSNQISAEQSEDSNPAALDTEPAVETEDKELETPDPKDEEFPFTMGESTAQDKTEEKMDVEEEFGTVQFEAETVKEINEEAKSAVDALLNADNPPSEQTEEKQEVTEQMDIETVKLSDTSDNEVDVEPTKVQAVAEPSEEVKDPKPKTSPSKSPPTTSTSPKHSPSKTASSPSKQSPHKMKNLAISTQIASSVVNIVDLEETSSSEDDLQEVQKPPEPDTKPETNDKPPTPDADVTNVNIPPGIEITSMCSGGNTSEITTKEGEVVISGVPKPPPHKPARLNTSEVSIKTVSVEPMVIPEAKVVDQPQTPTQSKPKLSLEIFSLDSDDEDNAAKEPQKITALELDQARDMSKCVNYCCTSDGKGPYMVADASVVNYYDAGRKRRSMVCLPCAEVVANRTKNLIQGIKDPSTPLLDLEMSKLSQDLVEISDSESEDEDMTTDEPKETIGEKGALFIEDNLAKYLNDTWKKYDMDVRLKETQIMLDDEIEKLEQDSKEIDAMLNECQIATDKLRCELYATFECRRQQLPAIVICDTPESKFIGPEEQESTVVESIETRQNKRRLSSTSDMPAKRPAIPLGYAPLDSGDNKEKTAFPGPDKMDDDKDISVVKLSAEAAPAELPPPGEISRPPLRVGMPVYAMKNAFGPWLKGRVLEIQPKNPGGGNPFSLCRIKFDHKTKTNGKVLPARCIAYSEPADVRMTIGTRLIALFKDTNKRESYYSGVVAEIPNPVNNYRYLVFFDDGYAQYVQHQHTRLVCESSPLVWEEVHPFSRVFVKDYLLAYPERPMVRLHEGQHLKTEWNGKWWSSRVTRVDASLAQVMFVGDGRREWIYRGSTRLAPLYLELRAAERHRPRPMPRSKVQPRLNMPYVEYTRSEEQEASKQADAQAQREQQQQMQSEEIRRQRAVAKKSTSMAPQVLPPALPAMHPPNLDPVTSRVVYYTPKNAVRPLKMVPHRCGPKCKRSDVLSLKELRTYNPLAKPLLSGWERQIVRFKGHKEVMYRAPCGRRLRSMRELHHYLRTIDSDLPVDLFDFHYSTHCLAEFVLNKCLVGKKDLSHGKENVPVPCVNYYDDSLPEFCSYNTERTPTAGVPLNLEPEFLCGCDCTDDCQDKSKCACWKMTLEGARTIGLDGPNVGYVYKRLPEPLPSGIYECNSRCKCKHTCLNRVAQHPLQLKLQVFKTPNRGWGIRALNDVPKGSFLCVYAGNLLTDATANLDGLNEGDEYLAELDYIEVVEQMKEGYEEDIPDADKKLDKKERGKGDNDSDEEESSSEEEDNASKTDKEDDDFRPGYIGLGVAEFSKRLRKRERTKKDKGEPTTDEKDKEKEKEAPKETTKDNAEEDCITISDDEEIREPSRFMAQTNMGANDYISKYKSVRTLFGKDEACYIMDAKVQGNIGRYLNHSCCPNVFVQNVFVDTHDPRFPWVAFFALSHIKAGTELTWNYNYDVGSVPGKVLYCYCGAPNCRGRLL